MCIFVNIYYKYIYKYMLLLYVCIYICISFQMIMCQYGITLSENR